MTTADGRTLGHERRGIAILIVNFRTYAALERCLTSIAPLLQDDDEIVLVDQESDAVRLRMAIGAHPRVRAIPLERNLGFAAGANIAARHSRAPLLLFLNPDTRVTAGALDTLQRTLTATPQAGVVGPRVLDDDGAVQESARRFPDVTTAFGGRTAWLTRAFPRNPLTRRNLKAGDATAARHVDWVSGACLMTSRDLFERLGGFDEGFYLYWEDADFCRRAQTLGHSTIYVPEAVVWHTAGAGSAHVPAMAIRAFHRSAFRMYRKHAGRLGALWMPLVGMALLVRRQVRLARVPRQGVRALRRAPDTATRRRALGIPAGGYEADGAR